MAAAGLVQGHPEGANTEGHACPVLEKSSAVRILHLKVKLLAFVSTSAASFHESTCDSGACIFALTCRVAKTDHGMHLKARYFNKSLPFLLLVSLF